MKHVDPVLILLLLGILTFTCLLIFVNYLWREDGQMFQVISGITTGFAGAFFARMKPESEKKGGEKENEK